MKGRGKKPQFPDLWACVSEVLVCNVFFKKTLLLFAEGVAV